MVLKPHAARPSTSALWAPPSPAELAFSLVLNAIRFLVHQDLGTAIPLPGSLSVCLLYTGVTQSHPLMLSSNVVSLDVLSTCF